MPALAILNPYKTYTQTLNKEDLYYKCIANLRKNPQIYEDSIILHEGLEKIDPTILYEYKQKTLIPAYSKKGAYQAIGAYNTLANSISKESTCQYKKNCEYYTFGHCGILSDTCRKESSSELYDAINNITENCYKQNVIPKITLCGYSHGGNIILYLGMIENLENKNIEIEKVILYGTPIQIETAEYAKHEIFKSVINIYSEGDTVQNGDSFSTPSSISYRTFQDLCENYKEEFNLDNTNNILDVRIVAQEDPSFFNHYSYWFFQRYDKPWFSKTDSGVQQIYEFMDPLPLAILTPIFVDLIDQIKGVHKMDLILHNNKNQFTIKITDPTSKEMLAQSKNIVPLMQNITLYAKESWEPYAQSSETKRIGLGIISAFHSLTA